MSLANKAVGGGSAVTLLSWLNSSNFGMWAGIAIGVVGLLVNWYFKHRSDKRADEIHRARMRALDGGLRAKDLARLDKPLDHHEADE